MEPATAIIVAGVVGFAIGGIGVFVLMSHIHTVAVDASKAITAATTLKTPFPAVNADAASIGQALIAAIDRQTMALAPPGTVVAAPAAPAVPSLPAGFTVPPGFTLVPTPVPTAAVPTVTTLPNLVPNAGVGMAPASVVGQNAGKPV